MSTRPERVYSDKGVVLRTYKLGESDRIVVLLTEANGKVRAVAKGVRKTKSRFGSRLEPLSHVSVLLYRGRELDVVNQVEPLEPAGPLRNNLDKMTQGIAMLEAVEQLTPDREPVPHIYAMLVGALRELARSGSSLVVAAFYWKLLASEGLAPELFVCVSCGSELEEQQTHYSFDIEQGGIQCRVCRSGRACSAEALHLLRLILGGRLGEALALDESPAGHEVGHLATQAVESHIERRLWAVGMFERHD